MGTMGQVSEHQPLQNLHSLHLAKNQLGNVGGKKTEPFLDISWYIQVLFWDILVILENEDNLSHGKWTRILVNIIDLTKTWMIYDGIRGLTSHLWVQ